MAFLIRQLVNKDSLTLTNVPRHSFTIIGHNFKTRDALKRRNRVVINYPPRRCNCDFDITSDKLEMLKFKYGRTSSRTVKKGLESSKLRGSANIRLGNHPGQNIN